MEFNGIILPERGMKSSTEFRRIIPYWYIMNVAEYILPVLHQLEIHRKIPLGYRIPRIHRIPWHPSIGIEKKFCKTPLVVHPSKEVCVINAKFPFDRDYVINRFKEFCIHVIALIPHMSNIIWKLDFLLDLDNICLHNVYITTLHRTARWMQK